MSELRLYSLSIIMVNAENIVFKNYKSGSLSETAFLELLNCGWHHGLYFTTVRTPEIREGANLKDGSEWGLVSGKLTPIYLLDLI